MERIIIGFNKNIQRTRFAEEILSRTRTHVEKKTDFFLNDWQFTLIYHKAYIFSFLRP